MNNELRERIQNDAHIAWLNNNKKGTVEIATGIGKTFVALHALHSMERGTSQKHLHLAETDMRKNDFLESVKKYDEIYDCNTLLEYDIEFACYQSAYKWKMKTFGLVIADEIHDSLTPEYSKFYENNDYEALIGLSAKVDLDTEYQIKRGVISLPTTKEFFLNKYCKIVYRYGMVQARNDELNRELTIHIINHKLDDDAKVVPSGKSPKIFYQTEKKYYEYWHRKFKSIDSTIPYEKRMLFKQIAGHKRNQLIYGLPSKIIECRKLLKHLDKTLIFGNNIDALQKITPYVVSSRNDKGKSKGQNEYFIRRFEEGKINNLAAFKKLKQGANITGLENLILFSYYSSEKDAIQRFGRLRNKEFPGNVFIYVTEGTTEEVWYLQMLKNISNVYKKLYHSNTEQCIRYLKYKDESKR